MNQNESKSQADPGVSAQEEGYLKLLKSLKTGGGSELGVVRRIAAWIDSPRVILRICLHGPWYDDWDVKEALIRNDATAPRYRQDLETKIAIFDLLHELDNTRLQAHEKVEIKENIKYLTESLSEHDRQVVKNRAYELSASRRGVTKPKEPKDAQAPSSDQGTAAAVEDEPPEVPDTGETATVEAPPPLKPGQTIDQHDPPVQDVEDQVVPEPAEKEREPSGRLSIQGVGPETSDESEIEAWNFAANEFINDLRSEFATDEELERDQVQSDVSDWDDLDHGSPLPPAPSEAAPVDVDTAPIDEPPLETADVDTAPVETAPVDEAPVESATEEPTAEESDPSVSLEEPEPIQGEDTGDSFTFDDEPEVRLDSQDLDADEAGVDEDALIAEATGPIPIMDPLKLAAESNDSALLMKLLEQGEAVQLAMLQNPTLDDRIGVLLARRGGQRVIAELCKSQKLFARPAVKKALLDSVHTPAASLLGIVNNLGDINGLLHVIKSPKIRHLEVKAKARVMLSRVFRSMGTGEKVAHIRRSGRFLLKELWTDFFRDEALVLQCLRQKQLPTDTVLEISKSRIAPRYALELISKTNAWSGNQNICMALVQNPKTPRHVVPKLVAKLSPPNRRQLKHNLRLPDYIRRTL